MGVGLVGGIGGCLEHEAGNSQEGASPAFLYDSVNTWKHQGDSEPQCDADSDGTNKMTSDSGYAYIDANYVRELLKAENRPEAFNPTGLWSHLHVYTVQQNPVVAGRMFFYDAVDENASSEVKEVKQTYLTLVEQQEFVSVATGFVRPGKKQRRQQKGVDVHIAVDALEAAASHRTNAIIVVAGDADFCPLADAVRRTGALFVVFGFPSSMSDELRNAADVYKDLPPLKNNYLLPFPDTALEKVAARRRTR